jgi:hypothetical protein
MVSEVQCTGSLGECLLCLFCATALARFYPASHRALLGRRTAMETPRVHASYPAHIFHYAAVGTLVELSWKHAHGPGRAVLGASWVRDILRNLKHRAFLTNAPRSRAPGGLRVL